MPLSSMPPELIDRTIDYLHDDGPALRACAATSQQFRTSSQLHLLDSVTISSRAAVDHLLERLELAPHVAAYINTVRVADMGPARSWIKGWPAMPVLLSKLPNVRYLTMQDRAYTPKFPRFDCPEIFVLTTVEEVVIEEQGRPRIVRDETALASFLSRFPKLRAVALGPTEEHTQSESVHPPTATSPPNFTLSNLRLSHEFRDLWTLEWLLPAAQSLERLHIAYKAGAMDYASRLIRSSAMSLQHLRFSELSEVSEADALPFLLMATECPNLRTLRIDSLRPPGNLLCPPLVLRLMSDISSRCLEYLTLSFDVNQGGRIPSASSEPSTWTRLEESLLSPKFPQLRRVEIRLWAYWNVGGGINWDGMEEVLHTALPQISSRHMLLIRRRPDRGRYGRIVGFPIH